MKLKSWLLSHSKQTRKLLLASFIIHGVFASGIALNPLLTRGVVVGSGTFVVAFLARILESLPLSLLIAWPLYGAFHEVAEKNKRYLDYVARVMLVITLIMAYLYLRVIWMAT